jgi:transposase-like protein
MSKTYSPEFNLQVVLEALQSDRTDTEIARAYDVHLVTLSNWKKKLRENGAKAFGGDLPGGRVETRTTASDLRARLRAAGQTLGARRVRASDRRDSHGRQRKARLDESYRTLGTNGGDLYLEVFPSDRWLVVEDNLSTHHSRETKGPCCPGRRSRCSLFRDMPRGSI